MITDDNRWHRTYRYLSIKVSCNHVCYRYQICHCIVIVITEVIVIIIVIAIVKVIVNIICKTIMIVQSCLSSPILLEKPMRKWILNLGQRSTLVRAQTGTKGDN